MANGELGLKFYKFRIPNSAFRIRIKQLPVFLKQPSIR